MISRLIFGLTHCDWYIPWMIWGGFGWNQQTLGHEAGWFLAWVLWNRWNWTHFVFCIKVGHNISIIRHISDMKPMGVSQSDMDSDMKSNFSDMRSDMNSYRTSYRCFSFAVENVAWFMLFSVDIVAWFMMLFPIVSIYFLSCWVIVRYVNISAVHHGWKEGRYHGCLRKGNYNILIPMHYCVVWKVRPSPSFLSGLQEVKIVCFELFISITYYFNSKRTIICKFHQNLTTTSDTLIGNHSSNNTDNYLRSKHNYFRYLQWQLTDLYFCIYGALSMKRMIWIRFFWLLNNPVSSIPAAVTKHILSLSLPKVLSGDFTINWKLSLTLCQQKWEI
jgi:hypothetical protein